MVSLKFARAAFAPFAAAAIAAVFSASAVLADSTVSIPVPDSVTSESKNLVLTITVPTSLERTYQQQQAQEKKEDKPKKTNFNKYFDMNPFPNMVSKEEIGILIRFANSGLIDETSAMVIRSRYIANNYEMARSLASIVEGLMKWPPELIAKAKITRADILDLVKVFDNYTKELKMFKIGGKERDYLNRVSQRLSFTDGEVKVVKVETNDIGGTVIHLTLNNTKGKYKPQYISKLEPLPQQTMEVNVAKQPAANQNVNPDSLQFSTGGSPPNGQQGGQQGGNQGGQQQGGGDQPLPPPPDNPPAPNPNGGGDQPLPPPPE